MRLAPNAMRRLTLIRSLRKQDFGKTEMKPNVRTQQSVSLEQRNAMIAQAAYYLAQSRAFAPGCELADWLEAEQQIADRLGEPAIATDRRIGDQLDESLR